MNGEEDPQRVKTSIAKPIHVRRLRRGVVAASWSRSPQMLLIYFVPGRCRCLGAVQGVWGREEGGGKSTEPTHRAAAAIVLLQ